MVLSNKRGGILFGIVKIGVIVLIIYLLAVLLFGKGSGPSAAVERVFGAIGYQKIDFFSLDNVAHILAIAIASFLLIFFVNVKKYITFFVGMSDRSVVRNSSLRSITSDIYDNSKSTTLDNKSLLIATFAILTAFYIFFAFVPIANLFRFILIPLFSNYGIVAKFTFPSIMAGIIFVGLIIGLYAVFDNIFKSSKLVAFIPVIIIIGIFYFFINDIFSFAGSIFGNVLSIFSAPSDFVGVSKLIFMRGLFTSLWLFIPYFVVSFLIDAFSFIRDFYFKKVREPIVKQKAGEEILRSLAGQDYLSKMGSKVAGIPIKKKGFLRRLFDI